MQLPNSRNWSRRIVAVLIATMGAAAPLVGHVPAVAATAGCSLDQKRSMQSDLHESYGRLKGRPAYTGIALLNPCGPIDVYETASATTAFQATAVGGRPWAEFRFHTVRNSLARLFRIQDAITGDLPALKLQGIHIHRYWPDMTTGLEKIEVLDGTASQTARLTSLYGPELIQAVSVVNPPRPVPLSGNNNPNFDIPPFSGGDPIYWIDSIDTSFVVCTSAFGAHTSIAIPQMNYMLTAGHCSAFQGSQNLPTTNTQWQDAYMDQTGTPHGSSVVIGNVSDNALSGSHLDAALIQTATATDNHDWQCSAFVTCTLQQQGPPSTPQVGATVCVNGAYDFTRCNAVIQQSGYLGCVTITGFNDAFCKEINFASSDGSAIVGEGDSGGGVFSLGPTFFAGGILSYGFAPLVACPGYYSPQQLCSSSGGFVDIVSVLQAYNGRGLALNT